MDKELEAFFTLHPAPWKEPQHVPGKYESNWGKFEDANGRVGTIPEYLMARTVNELHQKPRFPPMEFPATKDGNKMLVLSRKTNESIRIGNDIDITVVEIRGDKVRLGIVAPKEISVHRREVWDLIHATNDTKED